MTDRRFGGFWRRFFAYLIDRIVLYLVSMFLFVIGMLALGVRGASLGRILATGELPHGMGLFVVVYTVAMFFTDMTYFTWFHGSVGQTPGKMLLGLHVIQASGEGMTFGVAFLRWAGSLVSGLSLWLGYLWIAVDGRKQGWHDKIAATLVVCTRGASDDQSSPDAAVQLSPGSPPVAQASANPEAVIPVPPLSAPAANSASPEGASASDTACPARASVIPSAPASRDAADPAQGTPGELSGRG